VRLEAVYPRSFDRSSPVHAYWLAHCEGFRVRAGRRRGVVEDVACGPAGHASHLVVRFGLGRRSVVVPVTEVRAVIPDVEEVVLSQPEAPPPRPRRVGPAARRALSAADRGARVAAQASARAGVRAGRTSNAYARAAWRDVSRGSAATRRETSRFARWLAPRLAVAAAAIAAAARAAGARTAAVAAASARWVSAEGPRAARALAGRVSRLAARARAELSARREPMQLPPATKGTPRPEAEQEAPPDRPRETAA
jgi:hypothetical protein